jgi:superfamily II DNA or RNA helicase
MLRRYPGAPLRHGGARCCFHSRIRIQLQGRRYLATVSNFLGLPPPSPEQELVLKAVKQGRNARVNAVAGSGKTTTILQVAQAFPNRKILGMTFEEVADGSVIV